MVQGLSELFCEERRVPLDRSLGRKVSQKPHSEHVIFFIFIFFNTFVYRIMYLRQIAVALRA